MSKDLLIDASHPEETRIAISQIMELKNMNMKIFIAKI